VSVLLRLFEDSPLLPHTLRILLSLLSRLPGVSGPRTKEGDKAPLLEGERAWVDSDIWAHDRRLHRHI